jgi:hypothetical protein
VLRGRNPLKKIAKQGHPLPVTLTTVVYIPELAGYWEHSLSTLKLCLASLVNNSGPAFDLMVFDNGSCAEVRDYLLGLHKAGAIQYLFLSAENIGKAAALNMMFGAASGEIVGYTDSDVLFYPGWLEKSLEVFKVFGRVGMVCGRSWRPLNADDATMMEANADVARAMPGVEIERGALIPEPYIEAHARSIDGLAPTVESTGFPDMRLSRDGVSVFGLGSHFQYVTTKEVIRAVGPIPVAHSGLSNDERAWDERVRDLGYLRLALSEPYVQHLGNTLEGEDVSALEQVAGTTLRLERPGPPTPLPWLTRMILGLMRVPPLRRLVVLMQRHMYVAISARSTRRHGRDDERERGG